MQSLPPLVHLPPPLLSILIPAFNSKIGLLRVLKPLLLGDAISRSSIEVVISDDSPYPLLSGEEISQYSSKISRFRYIHNVPPLGAVQNWNYLLSLCVGEYYWICHHDEYLGDPVLSVPVLLQQIRYTNSDIFIFPLLKSYRVGPFLLLQCHTPPKAILIRLLVCPAIIFFANPIGPPSALIIRSSSSVLYDDRLRWFVDVDCYVKLFGDESRTLSILPFSCRLISDQNFDQSITRSIAPELLGIKANEANYLINAGTSANLIRPSRAIVFAKFLLLILRTFRTRLLLFKRTPTYD